MYWKARSNVSSETSDKGPSLIETSDLAFRISEVHQLFMFVFQHYCIYTAYNVCYRTIWIFNVNSFQINTTRFLTSFVGITE